MRLFMPPILFSLSRDVHTSMLYVRTTPNMTVVQHEEIKVDSRMRLSIGIRLFALLLLLCSPHALAAYPCPNGPGPGERQIGTNGGSNGIGVIPICESLDGDGSASSGPRWSTRWIAIAVGPGTVGVGKDQPSKRKAQKAAVQDCQKRGGGAKCKVRMETYDQCLAFAAGSASTGIARSPAQERAEQLALQSCHENGSGGQCRVHYSGCSYPVQID